MDVSLPTEHHRGLLCRSLCLVLVLAAGCAGAPTGPTPEEAPAFRLREGDLLFQDLDCGPTCEAIEKVTHGVDGARFSHIGLVVRTGDGDLGVLESGPARGVAVTALDAFLGRSVDAEGRPRVMVGRLKPEHRAALDRALSRQAQYLGRPYDPVYVFGDDRYYCSELLEELFSDENGPFFGVQPMTFDDPETGEVFPVWQAYFEERGVPIPEGALGLNPAGMSRSDKLRIVHQYGDVDGCPLARCAPGR